MIVYHTLSTLEADLEVSTKTLYSVSNNLSGHYRRAVIPKRDGTDRCLLIPDSILKHIQRRIAGRLLAYAPVSPYATAYRFGGRISSNAAPHVGRQSILKLDIRHFFDSVRYTQVKEYAFPVSIYAEPIRILLTMLCYYKEGLPQGAPTSPMISNIIMCPFDEIVGKWCRENGIVYTRYCDDMTFSGQFDARHLTRFVEERLREMGFYLHGGKTKVVNDGQRQVVTGLVVNERLNVPAAYRRRLRQEFYYIHKFGLVRHLQNIGMTDAPQTYLRRLLGRVSYVLQVTPENREMQGYRMWLLEQYGKTDSLSQSDHTSF
jgi:RNA-directed DNA polymerase